MAFKLSEKRESTPARGTRTQSISGFSFLFHDSQIRAYKLTINKKEFPGFVMIGKGYIFFNYEPNLKREEACIELMYRSSWHPSYDERVLYLHSYFDTQFNRECHNFYKSKGITHTKIFELFEIVANQLDISRIELFDGSSIKLPQCKWNLRVLNRLLQHSNQVSQHNDNPHTFYEKFGFQPYDKINSHRIHYDDLSPFIQEYIHTHNIPMSTGAEPILIELVKHMYTQCTSEIPFKEYEQLKNDIIALLDRSLTSDIFYKDISNKPMIYSINRNEKIDTIEFTLPIGGRKSKRKTKKHYRIK